MRPTALARRIFDHYCQTPTDVDDLRAALAHYDDDMAHLVYLSIRNLRDADTPLSDYYDAYTDMSDADRAKVDATLAKLFRNALKGN